MADTGELLVIGKVTAVYGVKGWVKIHSFTEPMGNFANYDNYYLEQTDQWLPIEFKQLKRHGKGFIGLIEGLEDRERAKHYCQRNISVLSSELVALEEGQFYWYQLEGLQVWAIGLDEERLLGTLDHMIDTGANDVLVVKPCHHSIDQRERLIPYLPDQVIKKVDIENGIMRVDWDPEF